MKAAFFEIDGIIAKDLLENSIENMYNNVCDGINPEIEMLDKMPINKYIAEVIKNKHNEGVKIIIVSNRDIKFDIVTNHWLSRNFNFNIETHFKPIFITESDFPLFKTGMVSLLIDIYKLDSVEIYLNDIREISLINSQLSLINKKIYLADNSGITLIDSTQY